MYHSLSMVPVSKHLLLHSINRINRIKLKFIKSMNGLTLKFIFLTLLKESPNLWADIYDVMESKVLNSDVSFKHTHLWCNQCYSNIWKFDIVITSTDLKVHPRIQQEQQNVCVQYPAHALLPEKKTTIKWMPLCNKSL